MEKKAAIQKQLKGPDSFQIFFSNVLESLIKNRSRVILTALGVVVIVSLGIGLNYWNHLRVEKRKLALAAIEEMRTDELKEFQSRKENLENQLASINLEEKEQESKGKDTEEKAPNAETGMTEKLESELAALKADHEKSQQRYKEFYGDHRDSPEGWMAGLRYAKGLVDQGNLSEAESIIADIFQQSQGYPLYQLLGGFNLIAVLEDQEKFQQALVIVEKMLEIVPKDFKHKVLLAKARLHYFSDQKSEAQKVLDLIIADGGQSGEMRKAQSMKGLLN